MLRHFSRAKRIVYFVYARKIKGSINREKDSKKLLTTAISDFPVDFAWKIGRAEGQRDRFFPMQLRSSIAIYYYDLLLFLNSGEDDDVRVETERKCAFCSLKGFAEGENRS